MCGCVYSDTRYILHNTKVFVLGMANQHTLLHTHSARLSTHTHTHTHHLILEIRMCVFSVPLLEETREDPCREGSATGLTMESCEKMAATEDSSVRKSSPG